ncbi:hypothetical protein CBS101457_005046 [Exobasidium rhododendri]|nr:hypothetical protein CBS101457_005046 [Exobasidium rhododendri]
MLPMQGALYGKADDCPSIRSSPGHAAASGVCKRLCNRRSEWPDQYCEEDEARVINSVGNFLELATPGSVKHWNARRKRNTVPPWACLRDGTRDSGNTHQLLYNYLCNNAASSYRSRWLIIPQVSYGWDMDFIESEINKMIPRGWFSSSSTHHLTVEVLCPAPLMSVHYFATQEAARTYRHPIVASVNPVNLFFTTIALFLLALVSWPLCGSWQWWLKGLVRVSVIVTFFIVLGATVVLLDLRRRESVDDAVGAAWALKGWRKTEAKPSLSVDEALQEVRTWPSLPPLVRTLIDASRLQRRADGWYVLVGTEESTWLAKVGADVKEAISKQRCGNLDRHFDA